MSKKKVMSGIFFVFTFLFILSAAADDTGILILAVVSRITLDQMKAYPLSFSTVDPNFKDGDLTGFTGISFKKLMELSGFKVQSGITVVGKDQYVGYITRKRINGDGGILAWEMDGNPISPLKGGPLKIIFRNSEGIHGSAYTWYVSAVFVDSMDVSELEITASGQSPQQVALDVGDWPITLNRKAYSIPGGWRDEAFDPPGSISALPLKQLFERRGWGRGGRITLVSYEGASFTMDGSWLDKYPILIAGRRGSSFLHPVFGGPLCVVFPVETHPALLGAVPESGSFFFLKTICVH